MVLRWCVGTVVIAAEWQWYTRAWLRSSTVLTAAYCVGVLVAFSPVLLLWAPLEALACAWRWRLREERRVEGRPGDGDVLCRVGSYNVQSCIGSDGEVDVRRTARVLSALNLDLVAVQEVEQLEGDDDQVSALARFAGYDHWDFVGTRPSRLGKGMYGNAILSRLPILERRTTPFEAWWGRAARACLLAKVEVKGKGGLWFCASHFQHDPTGLENQAQLADLARQLPKDAPAIIGVDSNMIGSKLCAAAADVGLVDWCGVEHAATFPASRPLYRLDGLLATSGVTIVPDEDASASSFDGQHHASDHLPVVGTAYRQLATERPNDGTGAGCASEGRSHTCA